MAFDLQQNDTFAWSKHMVSVATGAGSQNLKAVKAAGARQPVNGRHTGQLRLGKVWRFDESTARVVILDGAFVTLQSIQGDAESDQGSITVCSRSRMHVKPGMPFLECRRFLAGGNETGSPSGAAGLCETMICYAREMLETAIRVEVSSGQPSAAQTFGSHQKEKKFIRHPWRVCDSEIEQTDDTNFEAIPQALQRTGTREEPAGGRTGYGRKPKNSPHAGRQVKSSPALHPLDSSTANFTAHKATCKKGQQLSEYVRC